MCVHTRVHVCGMCVMETGVFYMLGKSKSFSPETMGQKHRPWLGE